ncbi:MAG: ATP-binding protein [Selenomonadaceae bacterium]|nr:ATP-binding protein [Selenomonadaceae bacterium]
MEQNFYLEKLSELEENFSVKIISGVRGSGKTTLLKNFAKKLLAQGVADDEIIFVDCADNPRLKNFQHLYEFVSDMIAHLDRFFLLADDIDRVADWEKAVNALFVGAPAEIYVTGSTDTLAEKISALLPENCDVLKLEPISFVEYEKFFPHKKTSNVLKDFLNAGSLPLTTDVSKNVLPQLLRGLGYEIIFDLFERNSLYAAKTFRELLKYLAQNVGTATNPNRLCKQLKTTDAISIKKFLNVISGAGLFKRISSFDGRTEKFYCIDNGLLRALSFSDTLPERILVENAVCIELLRRGANVHFMTFGDFSLNFILTEGGEKIFFCVVTSNLDTKDFSDVLPALPTDAKKVLISPSHIKKFREVHNVILQEFLSGVQKFY